MSRDDDQLNGKDIKTPSTNCEPYRYNTVGGTQQIIAPCGAIANSLFNGMLSWNAFLRKFITSCLTVSLSLCYLDTFGITLVKQKDATQEVNTPVQLSTENIAWKSDRDVKFGKPSSWAGTTKPINWPEAVQDVSPNAYSGYSRLLVWMRTAALPNFRKNYGDVVQTGVFKDGLPAGSYKVDINYCKLFLFFSLTC